jgi:hypothetical protein
MLYPYVLAELMQIDQRLLNAPEQVKKAAQNAQDQMSQMQDAQMQEGQQGAAPAQMNEPMMNP